MSSICIYAVGHPNSKASPCWRGSPQSLPEGSNSIQAFRWYSYPELKLLNIRLNEHFAMFIFIFHMNWDSFASPTAFNLDFSTFVYSWLNQIRVVYNVARPNALSPEVDKLYGQYKRTFEDYISSKVNLSFLETANLFTVLEIIKKMRWRFELSSDRTCRYCLLSGERRILIYWKNCWEDGAITKLCYVGSQDSSIIFQDTIYQ